MKNSHEIIGEPQSDDLVEWVRENEEAILAWTQTVKMTHYYRRMLLVVAALAFTAASAAFSAVLIGTPTVFLSEGVSNTAVLYRTLVALMLGNVVAGIGIAVLEYSRRNMSTRAATLQAIQIVRDDVEYS